MSDESIENICGAICLVVFMICVTIALAVVN